MAPVEAPRSGIRNEAQAAAAAAARAAAEARARARAAAQAQARAEAQRHTAATAQGKARHDAQAAQHAQDANKAAHENKTAAQQELDTARNALDSKIQQLDERGPRPGDTERLKELQQKVDAAQAKLDKATTQASRAQRAADEARTTADSSRRNAITQANSALEAQQAANTAAKAAGKAEPFREADKVRDVYDAGSLDAQAQKKLFGTRSVVTPQEAARADAKRVAEATARSPREGASELQRQLAATNDPAYREALAKESASSTKKIVSALGDPATRSEDAASIVKDLGNVATLGGTEVRKDLAHQLAPVAKGAERQRFLDALQANASDPKVVALGAESARQLRETNRYAEADAITNLSPEFKKAAAQSRGDAALRAEVDLNTAAEERSQVEDVQRQTDTDTRERAQQLLELAARDPKKLPPGISVEPGATPDSATLIVRNKQGQLIEATSVERDGDKLRLDSTQYDGKGGAQRNIVSTEGPNGPTTVTQASWVEADPAYPGPAPSIEELKNRAAPNVSVAETTVRRDGDALVQSSYTQDAQSGVTQTEKRYSTQKDKDGISDRLDERFHDGPVDKVDIKTTNIPPQGAKGPDGKPAKATVTQSTSYSQESVRLTGSKSKIVDSPAKDRVPTAADLEETAHRADDEDSSPRSWVLQVSKPNELDTQTFVEGQTDLSVVSRKKVEGNTVTETTEGKVPNPDGDGDPVQVSGKASRTYDASGRLTASHSDQTDVTGTRRVEDYALTEKRNAKGELEVTEHSSASEKPKDGAERTVTQDQTAVQTDQGPQLVRASQTITGPEGSATASISPEGQELTVNGQRVADPEQLKTLPAELASLGATTVNGLSQQVQDFNDLASGLHDALAGQRAENDVGEVKGAAVGNNYGLYRLQKSITTQRAQASGKPGQDPSADPRAASLEKQESWIKITPQEGTTLPKVTPSERITGGGAGGIQLLSGVVGLQSSVRSLASNVSQGNWLAASKDALEVAVSGASAYGGGNALLSALRGTDSGLTLGGKLSTLGGRLNPSVVGSITARFAVSLGVFAGGLEVYQGIRNGNGWQIASGVVTAGAAVGGYLAAGAAAGAWGGPAGAAAGALVALAAFGVTELFDWLDDSEHDIAKQQI